MAKISSLLGRRNGKRALNGKSALPAHRSSRAKQRPRFPRPSGFPPRRCRRRPEKPAPAAAAAAWRQQGGAASKSVRGCEKAAGAAEARPDGEASDEGRGRTRDSLIRHLIWTGTLNVCRGGHRRPSSDLLRASDAKSSFSIAV